MIKYEYVNTRAITGAEYEALKDKEAFWICDIKKAFEDMTKKLNKVEQIKIKICVEGF
jgi:hypothetical protein